MSNRLISAVRGLGRPMIAAVGLSAVVLAVPAAASAEQAAVHIVKAAYPSQPCGPSNDQEQILSPDGQSWICIDNGGAGWQWFPTGG
ncbi:hypothetical protein [Nocardia sp. NBC_01327]|uniref:hypothetical protein n=1 Tax=Nocardia sp. NBC_01327 TaxID=2903593 RepID=UPI002E0F0722|nr:hypothetical protein OG326_24655 [Nocardia sp. NBC_01327]